MITITTEDAEGNIDTSAASVQVTHQSVAASFPDANNRFSNIRSGGISLDSTNNRLVVSDFDEVFAVNLSTGARDVLIASGSIEDPIKRVEVDEVAGRMYITAYELSSSFIYSANSDGSGLMAIDESPAAKNYPHGMKFSPFDGRLYITDTQQVYSIDPADSSVLFEAVPADFTIFGPRGLDFVTANSILLAEFEEQGLFLVDLPGGRDTYGEIGTFTELLGPSDVPAPEDVEYDADDARAIVVDSVSEAVVSVPVAGGSMTTISNAIIPNTNNVFGNPAGIVVKDEENIAYVTSSPRSAGEEIMVVFSGQLMC